MKTDEWIELPSAPELSTCCNAKALAAFPSGHPECIDGYCSKCHSRFLRWDGKAKKYWIYSKPIKHVVIGKTVYEVLGERGESRFSEISRLQ